MIYTSVMFLISRYFASDHVEKYLAKKLSKISKYGFGIYIVHYFVVGPIFILIGKFDLPIPLQVPIMALLIFIISWAFTWFMYRILGERAKWIMG